VILNWDQRSLNIYYVVSHPRCAHKIQVQGLAIFVAAATTLGTGNIFRHLKVCSTQEMSYCLMYRHSRLQCQELSSQKVSRRGLLSRGISLY
jgi:hypothetical protein